VLLFDEPVNGLDPEGIHWVRNLMRQLAAEGRTVFVSSHLMSEMALTADHLVVIGRGQLLADMSVKDFIAQHSTGYALVRTPEEAGARDTLGKALTEAGAAVQPEQDGALRVTGLELPKISDVAYDAGVRLWELSPHQASLEEAYMRLTSGAVDYRSTQDPRQGLQQAPYAIQGGFPQGPPPPGWGQQPPPGWRQQPPGWGQQPYVPGQPQPYGYGQPPAPQAQFGAPAGYAPQAAPAAPAPAAPAAPSAPAAPAAPVPPQAAAPAPPAAAPAAAPAPSLTKPASPDSEDAR
jgi:ABC-2 type transport system ATP-binding protein